jgi:spore maturation protein SpmA
MEAGMNEIGKHAAFYRAYLPHDRSLIPVAVALVAVVVLWLGLYFISEEQDPQTAEADARGAAVLVSRPVSH